MLGQGKKSGSADSKIDTIIGKQTRITGDIHFSGGLHVDGTIKGNVIAETGTASVLTLSDKGNIEGDVQVPNVVLNGSVTGNVSSSERIELAANAQITGDVSYNLIEMAMGAEVNGSLVRRKEDNVAALSFGRENSESGNNLGD